MNRIILICAALFIPAFTFATQFTSNGGGNWNLSSTWAQTGVVDADGIPDGNDTVTVLSPDVVTTSGTQFSKMLTVNLGATLSMSGGYYLYIYGDLNNSGTVSGTGVLYIQGASVAFNNVGTMSVSGTVFFSGAVTISASTVLNKPGNYVLFDLTTVTNNGNVTVSNTNGIIGYGAASLWVQGPGAILNSPTTILGTGMLDASAVGNTVTMTGSGYIKKPVTSYYNLTLTNSTAKSIITPLTITNDFSSASAIYMNSQSLTVGGNYTCTGSVNLPPFVTFNGSGTQTVTGTNLTFRDFTVSGSGTVLLGSNITINDNLTINTGVLDVSASNFTITLKGDFTNNAFFDARNGAIVFNKTTNQTINGTSITTFYNMNLALSNGRTLSLNFPARLSGRMNFFGTNNFFNTNSNTFTLISNFFGTAAIGTVPAGSGLVGSTWVVQRFVPSATNPYWDYLATPVSGSTIQEWDNDFYMSAVGGNNGTACCPTFYSVRTFNESTNSYTNITSTATPIASATGYMCWLADDLNTLSAFTFDSRGTAVFGNQTKAVTRGAGAGFNLIGNPYPSGIRWSTFRATNSAVISNTYYILDDQLQNYASWNGTTLTGTGNLAVYNGSDATIPSSQGFMVVASTGGTLNFQESHKIAASGSWTKMNGNLAAQYLRIRVGSNMNSFGGETSIAFNAGATHNYDSEYDALFMPGPNELAPNIGTFSNDGKELLMNNLLRDGNTVAVPLFVKTKQGGDYTLTFRGVEKFGEYSCIYLEDKSTGKLYDLKKNVVVSFKAPAGTSQADFVVHFSNNESGQCEALAHQPVQNTIAADDISTNIKVFRGMDAVYANFSFDDVTTVNISVYNVLGEKVTEDMQLPVTTNQVRIALAVKGIYLVKVAAKDQVFTTKVNY